MKAYTVYQPYAYATMAGLKGYETRPRRTNIRGRVAVHAGKQFYTFGNDDERKQISDLLGFKPWEYHSEESGRSAEYDRYYSGCADLPHGAVIGTVEVVDCVPVEEIAATLSERERLLGDYSPGRWAWVLKNPVAFPSPIPARGKQGWWNWEGADVFGITDLSDLVKETEARAMKCLECGAYNACRAAVQAGGVVKCMNGGEMLSTVERESKGRQTTQGKTVRVVIMDETGPWTEREARAAEKLVMAREKLKKGERK